MFNSFTNWLNNLPVPIPLPKSSGGPNKQDEDTNESGSTVEQIITQQDKPTLDNTKQLELQEATEEPLKATESDPPSTMQADAQAALESAKEFSKQLGSKLFSFGLSATKQLQETAFQLKEVVEKNAIINDFNREHEKFVSEKKNQQRREEAALPPWVGYVEEENLKAQILALSMDSRNVLRSPPTGVEFQFDFGVAYPIALATLEEDPNLKELRFRLVPSKIKEKQFWCNYFYRVSLIKQSIQLNSLANENTQVASQPSASLSTVESNPNENLIAEVPAMESTQATLEFASDQYNDTINEDEIKRDMMQLKLDKELEEGDWDKELQDDIDNITTEELEKEINEMIESKK